MDVYGKVPAKLFLLACLMFGLFSASDLYARGIPVKSIQASADFNATPPVISVSAETALELPGKVEQALDNGITLDFKYEVVLKKHRSFIWNPDLFHWVFRRQLNFFTLSSKYVVSTDRDNSAQVFSNLRAALQYLNRLDTFRLALPDDLKKLGDMDYIEFQMRLDIESLPLPMRPLAYVSSSWRLHTDWTDAKLNP